MDMAQRRDKILELLDQRKYLSADEVADLLDASPATVRRDFTSLEEEGKVEKYHGGIKRPTEVFTERNPLDIRLARNIEEKQKIGKLAASFIEDNDVVFIDASSTVIQMIPYITTHNIKVFTHSFFIVQELLKYDFKPFMIGGVVHTAGFCYGAETMKALESINFTKAFLGIPGISASGYLVDSEMADCTIKKHLIENTKNSYCLATKDKFDTDSHFKITKIENTNVITTRSSKLAEDLPNIIWAD